MEKAMRVIFGEALAELGDNYPNLTVLDADVSSSTQTKFFGDTHPEKFYNFGIAEANMVSAAAGMSTCGLIPVVSTFAFLLAFRAGDAVRSLIAYNNLNVKIAGGYAGLSDFADGASHQSICDIAVMRSLPNMTVLVPSDIETTKGAVKAMIDYEGPVYLRLSRDIVGSYHNGNTDFIIGKAITIREGKDITIAVSGTLLSIVIEATEELKKDGISAEIIEYSTIKPYDEETLIKSASKTKKVITVEEHSIIGGLGGAVSEVLSRNYPVQVEHIGINDTFGESGKYLDLLNLYGLTTSNIINSAKLLLLYGKQPSLNIAMGYYNEDGKK